MYRNIGISLVTLVPYLLFKKFGQNLLENADILARNAKYDGLQLLPVRGITKEALQEISPYHVLSYEDSWYDPMGITDIKKKFIKTFLRRDPIGWCLFGTRDRSNKKVEWFKEFFQQADPVDVFHHYGSLIEIMPRNGIKPETYLTMENDLVFDTWHFQEMVEVWPPGTISPEQFIDELLEKQKIKLIHLQTRDKKDFKAFLNGDSSYMGGYLRKVASSGADIIVELPPTFVMKDTLAILIKMHEQTVNVICPNRKCAA